MTENMKNACQQNIGITYYGNDDSRSQWMHHTGSPALDAVHQIEDSSPAVYDDDPIAVEPQLTKMSWIGIRMNQRAGEIISAEPHKGSAE